jgi:phasin family protein
MADPTLDHLAEKNAEALSRGAQAAKNILSDGAKTLTESGKGSAAAVQELTKAYQDLAARNVKNLTVALEALVAAKSPTEFLELQQKLIKDGVASAVNDGRHIAELTTALFTAAFEPVKNQIEAAQKIVKS